MIFVGFNPPEQLTERQEHTAAQVLTVLHEVWPKLVARYEGSEVVSNGEINYGMLFNEKYATQVDKDVDFVFKAMIMTHPEIDLRNLITSS